MNALWITRHLIPTRNHYLLLHQTAPRVIVIQFTLLPIIDHLIVIKIQIPEPSSQSRLSMQRHWPLFLCGSRGGRSSPREGSGGRSPSLRWKRLSRPSRSSGLEGALLVLTYSPLRIEVWNNRFLRGKIGLFL